ncbi:hypothetical protein L1887_24392 [Cichorium endivia]|nr:hypothetical protein L1887_24392 [Cichorium endivia]
MARGNGVGVKGSKRSKIQQRDQDSEESDEEYNVAEDEDSDESDECYSFDGDESEEILADFGKPRRVARSRNTRRTSVGRNRNKNKITKPHKRRRISYTDDDDDDEFMSSGKKAKLMKKPTREKKKASYTEEDFDDEDFVSLNKNQRQKPKGKKRVSYTEDDDDDDDDDDDGGFMSSGRESNRIKKRDSFTKEDDDDEDDDYAEFVSFGRNRNQSQKPKDKKRVLVTEEDDDDDDDDDDEEDDLEFMYSGRKRNQRKKPLEKKRVLYTEDEDNDDTEFMSMGSEDNHVKKPRDKKRVSYTELDDDDDDDDYGEFVSFNRNHRKKPQDKNRVSDTEDDNDDDAEFMSFDVESKQIKKYTEDDDDDVGGGEDDAGFVSLDRKKSQEKKRVSKEEEEEEDHDDYDDGDDDDEFMYSGMKANQKKNLREKRKVSYTEDENDSEFISSNKSNPINKKSILSSEEENQEDEDEKDTEFKLSESDFLDDEEESPKIKKPEKAPQKKGIIRGRQKKIKNSKKTKKPTKPKQREKKTKKPTPESDSDFASPPSSDHEYTISEEEREQMREARVYCANLRAKLRSQNQEENPFSKQRKYPVRKGKEKIEDTKDEIGKQVCGICLSEEAKRTVRGVLNCCRHYFCFSCIMEWSKVESRCPLCKQRFSTITKAAKSDTGFDSRTVVIPVPECDQVYEPSEEELRGYLDPYESVICTECQHGGDDALMLLCDICDSSAHTFCVGLGREVPEGNWYCDGCRPTVFGSINSSELPSPNPGGFDLNELYVPETPLSHQQPPPPRVVPEHGDFMPATTLRDRRRIHRQIHHRFLNNNRRNSGSSSSSTSGIRLFGSQLDQARVLTPQREDHDLDQFACADVALESDRGGSGMGTGTGTGFDSRLGYGQLHPCTNRSSIGSDAVPSPYACREVVGPSRTSQGGFHAPY